MRSERRSGSKRGIWILGIVAFLLITIGGIAWYLSTRWKPILEEQIKQLVISSSDGLYRIEYSDFYINLISGNAIISNFKVIPDTTIYKKLVVQRKAPDNLYDLTVKSLVIQDFHPKLLYSAKRININTVLINKPTLIITNVRQPYNEIGSSEKTRSPYELISKMFKELKVSKILLQDVDFSFINKSNKPSKKTDIKNLNIDITDLSIDSLSHQDKTRFYYTRNIEVKIHDYKIATPDSLYYVNLKNFAFSASNRRLLLNSLQLTPRYSKIKYHQKVGYFKDRFDIFFDRLAINRIDLNRFIRDQRLFADKMDIIKGRIEVYNNNAYPKKYIDKTGKFPHQLLQKVAIDLKIDTLNIRNTLVSYSEYDRTSKRVGTVTFNRTSSKFYNVTNDSVSLSKNNMMRAYISSWVMNEAKFSLRFNFNLTDNLGAFTYTGTLGPFDGQLLNNIAKPLGMLEVNSGRIQKLIFRGSANSNVARGNMKFYYTDLKVKVLKRDIETGQLKKQGFVSDLTNVFIVQNDNPKKNGQFTEGTIYYVRPATVSFFGFLWQSMFTGIKESVGISREEETQIRGAVKKVGNFLQRMKEKQIKRKAEREKRRKERKRKRDQERNFNQAPFAKN